VQRLLCIAGAPPGSSSSGSKEYVWLYGRESSQSSGANAIRVSVWQTLCLLAPHINQEQLPEVGWYKDEKNHMNYVCINQSENASVSYSTAYAVLYSVLCGICCQAMSACCSCLLSFHAQTAITPPHCTVLYEYCTV
jgi:hypothetical protein